MSWQIRPAQAADMEAIAEIVDAHITGGVAHFGDRPIPAAAWHRDWEASRERFPWFVAERGGVMLGLAWAKRFNPRAAYDWTAEVSVYLRPGVEGRGLGTALYERLIATLDAQGYRCLVAGITLPNEASIRLHERFGFRFLGTLERVGYKHGRWLDVGSWQRHVGPTDDSEPAPPLRVDEVDAGRVSSGRAESGAAR